METKKLTKKLSQILSLFGLLVLSAAVLTGCGKSGSNSNANPYQYGLLGGTPFNGALGGNGGYSGVGIETSGRALIALGFGQSSGGTNAAGEIIVTQPIACPYNSMIGLSPGTYQLSAVAPASFSGSLATNVELTATSGPAPANVIVPFADIFPNEPTCGYPGLTGELQVVSIGGYQCGILMGFSAAPGASCQ